MSQKEYDSAHPQARGKAGKPAESHNESSVKPYVFWPPLDKAVRDKIVAEIVQEVCELPDYNSPPDQPDLLLCRVPQLENIIHKALGCDDEIDAGEARSE